MGLLGAISFPLALVTLTQILHSAQGCTILSATPSSASSILVKWKEYPGTTSYVLDLREKNSPQSAPIIVSTLGQQTEKNIYGLKPGTEYNVTVKAFAFFSMACVNSTLASTVPDASQIVEGRALSSTSISITWTVVPSAQKYFLQVYPQTTGNMLTFTYTNTTAVIRNLEPSSNYDCYVITVNEVGLGTKSKVKTVTTLVQPPVGITATQTNQVTARITWQPVKTVLLYHVKIRNLDAPGSQPSSYNVSDTKLDVQGILPCSTYLISVSSYSMFLVPSEPTDYTYTTNKLTPVASVSVDYSCISNSVMVSWSAVTGAISYKATATYNNRTQLECTSQSTSCQLSGLNCGQQYTVNVTPMSENCRNLINVTSATFQTAPCPPTNPMLLRECSSDVIVFSWNQTNNVEYYVATSVDSKGNVRTCMTKENSCYFTNTYCGRYHNFTVQSVSDKCKSNMSSPVGVRTAPCIPQNLQTSANCKSDSLLSKWDNAEGALHYTVEAVGNYRNTSYSCSSVSNSCVMQGIMCGDYLTMTIRAFDDECPSPTMLGFPADTVPCSPERVSAVKNCAKDSIYVTWQTNSSAFFYIAMAKDSNGNIYSCNSMDMFCTISGLKCSTIYKVYVIASNFMCNSSNSDAITIESAACPPNNLTATLDCAANEALISWYGEPSMNSYTATIVDASEGLLSCSSTQTNCKIPNLKCGQLYTVTVSQHDGVCSSMPSKPIYMESVPCGPANAYASVDCASGGVTVSWNASKNAERYMTRISDSSTQVIYNTTKPELNITLQCGQEYTVKVMSFNGSCVSRPSELYVREAPCVPTNLGTRKSCGQDFVDVVWQASRGAINYTAAAVDTDGNYLKCATNETTCRLKGVICGRVYNVSVVAMDNACTSVKSPTVKLQSEPCPPSQLTASVNCNNNTARLTWNSSANAVSYTGKAVSEDGHNVTCNTRTDLTCNLEGLYCGKKYTFTVSASDGNCQSPDSKPVIQTTAPCAVQNMLTTLSCNTNMLTISWTPGSMPVNYNVTAVTTNGTELRCVTQNSSCTIPELQCGQQYDVNVKPISSTCEGPRSILQTVNSVPCVPTNIQSSVECSINAVQGSWNAAAGAASYISTLTGAGGFSASCSTVNQRCLFPGLQCAQTYMFSVLALNDRCNSSKSAMVSATTAPCDPTNVSASLNCLTDVVTVTWRASAGANYYTVLAEAGGYVDSCNSTNTSCELTKLRCGQDYIVTVLAGDTKCNSSLYATTNITTAPCAPVIQGQSLNCTSNKALVTWVKDEDAMSVMVNATSSLGNLQSCSSSANNSCVLDLLCGNTYTVKAVAKGPQCLSKPSSTFQIVTAPCTPANVGFQYSCETGIALVSWDETLGRKSFFVQAQSGNHTASCSTNQTDCFLPTLLCSRTYSVKVVALADLCNSSVPGITTIQTAPCAPVDVNASLVCDNNTVAVSWPYSAGAVSYTVKAVGRDGDLKQCTTNNTSCLIPNMHCSQTYIITVTPFSTQCQGRESYPLSYTAGSCPPTNVRMSLLCDGNMGYVTWDSALQADLYVATTAPSLVDKYAHNCSSSGTDCFLRDLRCGDTVAVTVVTIERGCKSKPSLPVTLQTVICPPANVTGVTTCSNNDITVSWNRSPESGVTYFIRSQEDSGAAYNYSTTQTFYVMNGLKCGKSYMLAMAAQNSQCTSVLSRQIQTDTAPCPPTNLTVKTECATNLAMLKWAPSTLAISYTATLTGTHGHIVSCNTNTTNCSVKVDCAKLYSAVVVASSATCNSNASASLTFNSAPCLPDRVQAELDCSANSFAVQWRGTFGDTDYTAVAIGGDKTRNTCNSSATNCVIQNLKCGLMYSIVVTTSSVDCGVIQGSNYGLQSAPCKPASVLVNLQCSTNTATVSWGNSGPDQMQVVSAVDSKGTVTTCNSTSSNCTFGQLKCGELYAISVVGNTNNCSSEPAFAQRFNTAPCVPTHPTARVDCNTGITAVTWDAALGATSYTVYARGSLGYKAECNNTDTSCNFLNLGCGQDYNITVVARRDTCVSVASETIRATTGPCPHSGLKTSLDCITNTAIVSWTPGNGILYYNASAEAFNFIDKQTCSTNGSSCNISSLRCGESYKVSVSGQGQNCPSPAQEWHRVNTAPCPPTQLMVNSSCTSNNISVSWQASSGSVSYMAVATNEQGRQWSCNTSSTSCQISGLLCGQQYTVYVVGVDDKCTGAKSDVKKIRTAPCVPEKVQNYLDCLSGVLNVTWQSTGYFLQFHASVVNGNGHTSVCTTTKHHCIVHNLQCGQTYNVTVVAQDEACNSSRSPIEQVSTAPCPPSSFLSNVNCGTRVVSVTWNNSVAGVVYTVSAVDAKGTRYNCSSTNNGCNLSTLKCGTEYNVTITPSRNECVGQVSQTKRVKTVPCVPHLSDVEMDCLTNSAWVMYNQSAGAEGYIVVATDSQGAVRTFECNSTSDGMCSLPPLTCSQNFTVTLKAKDQQCTSAPSNAVTTETAPCPPDGVKELVNCDNGTVTISWSAVSGALMYTATLENTYGVNTTCCTTSRTSCNIKDLPCGEIYIVHVMAEGRTCNSSESEELMFRTVPCVPENLKAKLSCSNNVASMSWSSTKAGELYSVNAVGTDGHVDGCRVPDKQCDLTNLHCGQYYTATVTAEHIECKSKPSENVTIKTVPCTPANISSVVDCEANSLMVSWSNSSGADSYIATLYDSNGQGTTCQGTTEGFCKVPGLGCGQIYHVSVVSSDGYCNSPPTPVVDTPSVPCKAINIKAEMDCEIKTAMVEWYPSDGALSYIARATAKSGHNVTCDTNMTNCELTGLLCGQSYSVSVKAVAKTCSSITNMRGLLVTEPCIPAHIITQYSMTIGQVQWDMTAGADYYTVTGQTDQGLTTSCITNDTYCALYNMNCGQIYSINITASNRVCRDVSTSTEGVTIVTEPCPPNNVQTNANCQNDQGTVTWEESFGAVGYQARFAGRDGHSLSCYTNTTSCSVQGLHCGVIYHTTVIAVGETRNSSSSNTVLLYSAPCAVGKCMADLDCYNNTAKVSWSPASGANSYMVTAVSADGYWASCESVQHQCDLTELECGQVYNITLVTISDYCQTETNTNVSFRTRPCKPLYVGVDLQCGTTANMYWEESEGVELYMATATRSMGTTLKCNSTGSACQFSNLTCGETYGFSVTAYSKMCYSETSSTLEIQTGPCQPAGLRVRGSCNNETVLLDWSKAKGALSYIVTADGNLGYSTAFQSNETMLETNLPCGQLFTFTVIAQDNQCDSAASLPKKYMTTPCIPAHVQSFTQCEDSLGSVSWAMSDGAESYMAIAKGHDGHVHTCTTNTTICTWKDLHCGEKYTIYVVAMDYMCTSTPSNSTSIQMAPCIPHNLTSSLNCTTKVASLAWEASESAKYYIVTAETNSGHKVQLSTNNTSTYISEFLCGQEYFMSVQAADSVCTSRPSLPSKLKSVPCSPTSVNSFMNCISNIAVVSWAGSAGAEYYIAKVTTEEGQSSSCWSDSEQCAMPNVLCGQNYTVTVVASNMKCDSVPSKGNPLESVPCVPTNVRVKMDCFKNQAVVSWSASSGAVSYKVTSESTQGAMSICQTEGLTCTLRDLICGHDYYVQVVAEHDTCTSLPSPAVMFHSVPCTPSNGTVILDCFTNSALLDWAYAEGALYYSAIAESSSGHVSTCFSNITNCELLDLQCGQIYDVTTVASNDECSSPPSSTLQVESVPCPPEGVVHRLDCFTNTAQVKWQASRGADYYTVQAFGVEEHETSCETSLRSCNLTNLLCGFTYNISVIAVNHVCNVSESNIQQMQAVPCVPQLVEAQAVCESGAVAVSWEPSKGALSYTAVAQGSGGYASLCNNSDTACLFSDLLCGLNYSITVTASDDTCRSAKSSAVKISTVPCVPQKVTAKMVCSNDTGVVSWEEGEGVSTYRVQAFGPDGHKTGCNTTKRSCELPSMHCGQLYNLTVTAQDGRCDNSRAYLNLQSVPCKPTSVKASLQCRSNSAAVTWDGASGALLYLAVGVTPDGRYMAKCNSTVTFCDLSDLQCGQTYNVSVFSKDESCSSVESDKSYMRTAPCPPQNVVVDARCAEGAMVVSWSPNPDAQYFSVAAVSNTGARLYCNSSGNSCTINNLPCGQSYNITVLSVRDGCQSKPSAVVQTSSAPCRPTNIKGRLDCISNNAWVTWDDSVGATSYFVLARAANGHNSSCTTTSSPCKVQDLNCGTLYTFKVQATNKYCSSSIDNATFELETGPCALTSITAMTECNSDTILVKWEITAGTPLYVVTAEGDDNSIIACNSTSTSCLLQNVRCGMYYSIIVATSSDKCSSLRSPPKKIKTAPCVPSNVTAVPSCKDAGATVAWANSLVATSYELTATGQDGHVATCNTSVNNCSLAYLHCGQLYNLSITAKGENCTSYPSKASFKTVPCAPSDIAVDIDCQTNSAFLSWNTTPGAMEYFTYAQSMKGVTFYCNSSNPSCTFKGLECGNIYNFSVRASNRICNSSDSSPLQAGAVPCPPPRVKVRMQRIDLMYWAMISWDRVTCPNVEYLAEISGQIKNNPQALMVVSSYWLPRPYFEFPVPCSTAFNITVRSKNSAGIGKPSSPITALTAPCAPVGVTYTSNRQSSVLSWNASVFATSYTVYNVSGGTRVKLCNTTELFCNLTNFDPDATKVTASNAVGESNPSQNITGPVTNRRRRDLQAAQFYAYLEEDLEIPEVLTLTGSGVSLHVKWTTVKGATEYTLVIKEEQVDEKASEPARVRITEGDSYTETDLKPRTTYCVRVAAKNDINQSNYSQPKCRNTDASVGS